jgi:hypothetical protein
MYLELSYSALIDPSEQLQFATLALTEGDVEFYKSEVKNLIRYHGYFFTYEDTLRSPAMTEKLKSHNLVDWLVDETKLNYPLWVKENPEFFFRQQTILELKEANTSRLYLAQLVDFHKNNKDTIALEETLKYLREFDFNLLWKIVSISKDSGLPTNFNSGFSSYYAIQQIIMNNAYDEFNFKRTWHHIFPFLEKAYFDGQISNSFLKIYDKALEKHNGYQYYGTIDGVKVLEAEGLAERRKKFKL